jgi:hypothetical protein
VPQALIDAVEPVNILYYGEGGSGKSTDLAHMANGGKVWIANAEGGTKARALRQYGIPIENIEVFPDPDTDEVLSFEGLEMEWQRIREELHEDPSAYYGVGWDSVTEIQQALKDIEMKRGVLKANRRGAERDPFTMDQDNWRVVNEQCRQLIRRFRDLPCHFAVTALQRREQDNDGAVVYMPAVTPGLQNDLIGWMDVICHTDTIIVGGEDVYMGLFRNRGKYRGKDRFNMMPRQLVDPFFTRVLEYIDGDLTLEDDEEMQDLKARVEREEQEAAAAA